MNKKIFIGMLIIVGVLIYFVYTSNNAEDNTLSPYVGEETRGIKSLSRDDVEGLLAGHGTPFGGMAKLAELNGYPGPRHVLDLANQLDLTTEQKKQIQDIYDDMESEAIALGKNIIALEQDMNDKFTDGSISEKYLEEKVKESAQLYGELRHVHLQAHLLTMDILTPDQIQTYNELRGYTSEEDPCENIPEGHPEELWKLHNNCE